MRTSNQPVAMLMHALMTTLLVAAVLTGTAAEAVTQSDSRRWLVTPDVNDLDDWDVQPNSTALAKALGDAAEYVKRFKVPGSVEDWKYRRPFVDKALKQAIGLAELPERTPLNAVILATHDMGDYLLSNIIFESRPGFPVTANLYRPKNPRGEKLPAILCPIGHILDAGKAHPEPQSRCIQLTRMGFVVLVYDAIGQGERLISGNIHHEAQYALLPLGETIAGWMVWDSIRALDYLSQLPEVDPTRIGLTGNSGGGLNTLYTAALDSRVAVASVAGYTFQFSSWMKYAGAHGSCSQLIGLYRKMEWFEIAGLIAPRPLQMLQGEFDRDFPVSSARQAGWSAEALYALLGARGLARLEIVPKEEHAYSRPYRERMYGWMALHLLGHGDGSPLPEAEILPLPEDDVRLKCDPEGSLISRSQSVVALARRKAHETIAVLSSDSNTSGRTWLAELTEPPDEESHFLAPALVENEELGWARLEKVYFVSEIGQHIPGLLWLPKSSGAVRRTVILVDDRGKGAVAESGLVEPLVGAGSAVLSVDLRGRGETLGRIGDLRDNNYHFVLHSILWGRPASGRRAYDLKRTIDFVGQRGDLPTKGLVLVGRGDEALPALLAAASDERISKVACVDFYSSLSSQIVAAELASRDELVQQWNTSAMRWGRIQGSNFRVDLGSVIPSILLSTDIPELVALVAPRRVLYCQTRDREDRLRRRFADVIARVATPTGGWLTYSPEEAFSAALLLDWMDE